MQWHVKSRSDVSTLVFFWVECGAFASQWMTAALFDDVKVWLQFLWICSLSNYSKKDLHENRKCETDKRTREPHSKEWKFVSKAAYVHLCNVILCKSGGFCSDVQKYRCRLCDTQILTCNARVSFRVTGVYSHNRTHCWWCGWLNMFLSFPSLKLPFVSSSIQSPHPNYADGISVEDQLYVCVLFELNAKDMPCHVGPFFKNPFQRRI